VAATALAVALATATYILVGENRRHTGAPAADARPTLVVGAPAPDLRLRDAGGRSTGIGDLIAGDRPTTLVFVSPGCGPCEGMLPHLARWRSALAERVELVVISDPPNGEDGAAAFTQFPGMIWDEGRRALEAFRVHYGTPAAVMIDPEGTIASTPVSGLEAIEALMRLAQQRAFASRPLAVA
jgi:thiol-disulfide isomerase/thioredoxin